MCIQQETCTTTFAAIFRVNLGKSVIHLAECFELWLSYIRSWTTELQLRKKNDFNIPIFTGYALLNAQSMLIIT